MSDQNNEDNPWSNPGHKETSNTLRKKPSKSENNEVWGKKSQRNIPEENIFEQINTQFKKFKDQGGNGNNTPLGPSPAKTILLGLIGAAVIWMGSGFYRVQEGELAVVLRFGKLSRISNAGLQYRLPYPFEREIVKRVDVLSKIDSEIKGSRDDKEDAQTLILTGDENVVHTNYTVLWKIRDITEYLFTSNDPESTIIVAAESAIREVLGQTTARLALTEGRGTIGTKAQELLQKILDSYKLGVQIVSVQLQRVEPPSQVIKAFNDMQASLVDADRLKNEAESYTNEKLPNTRATAQKNLQEAEGYKQKVVLLAKGEAARFEQMLKAYKINPDLTKRRYFLETIQKVLSGIEQKTIIDGKVAPGVMPYLNLKPSASSQKDSK